MSDYMKNETMEKLEAAVLKFVGCEAKIERHPSDNKFFIVSPCNEKQLILICAELGASGSGCGVGSSFGSNSVVGNIGFYRTPDDSKRNPNYDYARAGKNNF